MFFVSWIVLKVIIFTLTMIREYWHTMVGMAWYGHVLGSSSHVERLTDFGFGGIGELLAAPRVESDEWIWGNRGRCFRSFQDLPYDMALSPPLEQKSLIRPIINHNHRTTMAKTSSPPSTVQLHSAILILSPRLRSYRQCQLWQHLSLFVCCSSTLTHHLFHSEERRYWNGFDVISRLHKITLICITHMHHVKLQWNWI